MMRRLKAIQLLLALGLTTLVALVFQSCLIGGDSASSTSVNGKWLLVREIDAFTTDGVTLRDTVAAPTSNYERIFLEIDGAAFQIVTFNEFSETPETTVVAAQALEASAWRLDGDSVSIVRDGSLLRITHVIDEGESQISEFSAFTGTVPPISWGGASAPDVSGMTGGELWQFQRQIYQWSDGVDSGIDTFDFDLENEITLLRIKGDTLVIHDERGANLLATERSTANTWQLFDGETFVIISKTASQLVLNVSGTQANFGEEFSVRVTLKPYTAAFPPPIWSIEQSPTDLNEPNNTFGQATPLTVGTQATPARLAVDDADWYSFPAQSGTTYILETFSDLDTYIRLYGADGITLLNTDDDAGEDLNAQVVWTAPSTGRYYFTVRGFDDQESGFYYVRAVEQVNFKPGVHASPRTRRGWRPQ
jgi:hypothetical protein